MDSEMKKFQDDLLESVKQMRQGKAARTSQVELSPAAEARAGADAQGITVVGQLFAQIGRPAIQHKWPQSIERSYSFSQYSRLKTTNGKSNTLGDIITWSYTSEISTKIYSCYMAINAIGTS